MKRFVLPIVGFFLFLAGIDTVPALTVIPRDFDELVARADTVFRGAVADKTSLWVGTGQTRHIATRVTFRVDETYKGDAAARQTLEFVGGTVGDTTLEIPGLPKFEVGQTVVLFVVGNGVQFCPLVSVQQGRFHVVKDRATGSERVFTDDGLPVADTADLGRFDDMGVPCLKRKAEAGAVGMTADDFKSAILRKVAALAK